MHRPELNPYQSPQSDQPEHAKGEKPLWRFVPAGIFGIFGCLALLAGLAVARLLLRSLSNDYPLSWSWHVNMLVFFASAGLWLQASWFYCRGEFRPAVIATILGFAPPLAWEFLIKILPPYHTPIS